MALALANGFISSGLITPSQILASAPSDNNLVRNRERLKSEKSEFVPEDLIYLFRKRGENSKPIPHMTIKKSCKNVISSFWQWSLIFFQLFWETFVKISEPESMCVYYFTEMIIPFLILHLSSSLWLRFITTESKLFISIMAGTKMETLAGNLRTVVESPRIIRVHPNTPAMVGQGCSVYSIGEGKWMPSRPYGKFTKINSTIHFMT